MPISPDVEAQILKEHGEQSGESTLTPQAEYAGMIIVMGIGIALLITLIFMVRTAFRLRVLLPQTLATIVLLVALLGSLEDDCFTLLRFIICPVAIHTAHLFFRVRQPIWSYMFGSIALLYNPIFPVSLKQSTWSLVNLGVILLLSISVFRLKHDLRSSC